MSNVPHRTLGVGVGVGVRKPVLRSFSASCLEGEGNHSTSVISRLGLVGGGGAVVMV